MAELATRLRANADQLWLLTQGWSPPPAISLENLLTETSAVVEEMTRRNKTRNVSSPDQV
jgi:hypothetical protein